MEAAPNVEGVVRFFTWLANWLSPKAVVDDLGTAVFLLHQAGSSNIPALLKFKLQLCY